MIPRSTTRQYTVVDVTIQRRGSMWIARVGVADVVAIARQKIQAVWSALAMANQNSDS